MRSQRRLWTVVILIISAFLLRLYAGRFALSDGSVLFYGPDSYYHMRRIIYTVNHFPATLWFDSYVDYPNGLEITWPPLFDILGAALASFGGSAYGAEVLASLLPPALGALTVGIIYLAAREMFDERIGLASAFFLTISSYAVAVNSFGYVDHHALEMLLLLLIVLSLLRSASDMRWSAAAGISIALLAYTWMGSAAYILMVLIYIIARISLDLRDGREPPKDILAASAIASMLVLPFWSSHWMLPSAIAIFALFGASVLGYAIYILSQKRLPWYSLPGIMIAAGLIVLLAVYALRDGIASAFYTTLVARLPYIIGGEMSGLIEEASPLLTMDLKSVLGLNIIITVAVLALVARQHIYDRKKVLLIIWTLIALLLTFGQKRFLYILAMNMSILFAVLFSELCTLAERRGRRQMMALTLIILVVMAMPSIWRLSRISDDAPDIEGDWVDALRWLKEETPPTSFYDDPSRKPEYGIMSSWSYGNWIIYLGKRPVIANNFQAGVYDSTRFFLSESESDAEGILNKRGARYVITTWEMLYLTLPSTARWIGEDPSSYLRYTPSGKYLSIELTDRLRRTMLARLQLYDGLNMSNLRLVYESGTFRGESPSTASVKIFEHVPGALVTGRSSGPVVAILNITTNQGRRFQYAIEAAPVDGVYTLRLPYSTGANGAVRADGDYLIMNPEIAKELSIEEKDVLEGSTLHLDL
ncbi:MAG: glycosyltransferase family 39 protein [Methanothrix sp.]|uniref:STT3 domain-containing protein n=1 Tax=Methanothrix sp. TaxID=90426 RepID=UPI0025CEA446|nr:STT3 domain-containing protein [Methanothrix sp.]MCQ8904041.1 glycosyltransferase family 39 protein [Methanothrix sp.]